MDGELLINEVYSRTPIWQSRHKNYRNRGFIEKMWDEIAKALDSTKDEARSRWKNMRDHYRKELKRSMSKTGKPSTWPYFELLHFLKEEINPSLTSGNSSKKNTDLDEGEDEADDNGDRDDSGDGSQVIYLPVKDDGFVDEERVTSFFDASSNVTQTSTNSTSSRKRKDNIQDIVAKKMLLLDDETLELPKTDNNEHCEDYHFLMSLLPHLKDIPPLKKLKVRNKITQVVIDAKSGKNTIPKSIEDISRKQKERIQTLRKARRNNLELSEEENN